MIVLAIDTCEGFCSAAVVKGRDMLACKSEELNRGHAERLLPMLDELLMEAGFDYASIDRLAVTTGPGTFTGLRVGLSVARGLALTRNIPCLGFSSLEVIASQGMGQAGDSQPVHSLIMGRGGQAFHQCFQRTDLSGLPVAISEPAGMDKADILTHIHETGGLLAGSGQPLFEADLDAAVFTSIKTIDPVSLAILAQSANPEDHSPDPAYLRAADAKKAKPLLPVSGL